MIISYIGGIGSGKTLSVVKDIVTSNNHCLTNFKLKGVPHYKRLKITDILTVKDKKYTGVNWEYWEKLRQKNFSIYLDEAHNIIHSRASMTKRNILLTKWISQIRKILADSETNHIYIITQVPKRIDVAFRDLTQVVVSCSLIRSRKNVYILQKYYNGFDSYEMGRVSGKTYFLGNPYFKYYNTKEMVRFTDADEYI